MDTSKDSKDVERKGPLPVESLSFARICRMLDDMMKKKPKQKKDVLIKLWQQLGNQNVFPLMRLLLPQLDSDRATYGLREMTIADMYIKAMQISKTSDAALRLKNYRNPRSAGHKADAAAGDFATILYDVLKTRAGVAEGQSTTTITEINKLLDALAQGEKDDKRKIYVQVVTSLSAKEQFWFCRIILKDLKIGMRHESMLKEFHPKALDIYNSCSSLARVCELVNNPDAMKAEFCEIKLFAPMKPMLCNNPTWNKVVPAMKGSPFAIEDKLDGERIIIHKSGSEVKLFTRNSVDYTEKFGYGAIFIPIVLQAVKATNCIIDGEMLTWNDELQTFEAFGRSRTTAINDSDGKKWLCYNAFDLLYLENSPLLELPLSERRAKLVNVVREVPHRFEVIKQRTDARTTMQVMESLDEAMLRGREGIIIKNLDSHYLLNDRSNFWCKVKHDYVEGMGEHLDLLILGAYYGEGKRRAGDVSHFLLGVAEKTKRRDVMPQKWFTFGKVGSGYSLAELQELRNRLKDKWKPYHASRQPKHFQGWKHEKSDIPDVWIEPEHSVVLALKYYEITECKTTKFLAGYCPRFPRVSQFRYDKEWWDVMNIEDMKNKFLSQRTDLRGRGAAVAHAGGHGRKTEPGVPPGAMKPHPHDESFNAAEQAPPSSSSSHSRMPDSRESYKVRVSNDYEDVKVKAEPGSRDRPKEEKKDTYEEGEWGVDGFDPNEQERERQAEYAAGVGEMGAGMGLGTSDQVEGMDMAEEEQEGKRGKRKKKAGKPRAAVGVLGQFRATDVSQAETLSNLLAGKELCILSDDLEYPKEHLETLIHQHGGSFVQNPVYPADVMGRLAGAYRGTDLLLASKDTFKVRMCRNKGIDVVNTKWLVDSIAKQQLLPFTKKYIIYATEETQAQIAKEIDPFGDQYAVDATRESLLEAFAEVRKTKPHPMKQDRKAKSAGESKEDKKDDAMMDVGPDAPPYRSLFFEFDDDVQQALESKHSMFRRYVVYLDRFKTLGDRSTMVTHGRLTTAASFIELYSGTVSDTLHEGVTHVVVTTDPKSPEGGLVRLDNISAIVREMRLKNPDMRDVLFVTVDWVMKCIDEEQVVDPKPYAPLSRGDGSKEAQAGRGRRDVAITLADVDMSALDMKTGKAKAAKPAEDSKHRERGGKAEKSSNNSSSSSSNSNSKSNNNAATASSSSSKNKAPPRPASPAVNGKQSASANANSNSARPRSPAPAARPADSAELEPRLTRSSSKGAASGVKRGREQAPETKAEILVRGSEEAGVLVPGTLSEPAERSGERRITLSSSKTLANGEGGRSPKRQRT